MRRIPRVAELAGGDAAALGVEVGGDRAGQPTLRLMSGEATPTARVVHSLCSFKFSPFELERGR